MENDRMDVFCIMRRKKVSVEVSAVPSFLMFLRVQSFSLSDTYTFFLFQDDLHLYRDDFRACKHSREHISEEMR